MRVGVGLDLLLEPSRHLAGADSTLTHLAVSVTTSGARSLWKSEPEIGRGDTPITLNTYSLHFGKYNLMLLVADSSKI